MRNRQKNVCFPASGGRGIDRCAHPFSFSAGNGPVAVYLCDDCGQFHLTSKGKMNDRLAEQMKNGSIDLQKEANWWMDKFKKS